MLDSIDILIRTHPFYTYFSGCAVFVILSFSFLKILMGDITYEDLANILKYALLSWISVCMAVFTALILLSIYIADKAGLDPLDFNAEISTNTHMKGVDEHTSKLENWWDKIKTKKL